MLSSNVANMITTNLLIQLLSIDQFPKPFSNSVISSEALKQMKSTGVYVCRVTQREIPVYIISTMVYNLYNTWPLNGWQDTRWGIAGPLDNTRQRTHAPRPGHRPDTARHIPTKHYDAPLFQNNVPWLSYLREPTTLCWKRSTNEKKYSAFLIIIITFWNREQIIYLKIVLLSNKVGIILIPWIPSKNLNDKCNMLIPLNLIYVVLKTDRNLFCNFV